MNYRRISVVEARLLLEAHGPGRVQIVDIRDDQAYLRGHIESAVHLHNGNLQEFIEGADLNVPLLVYCYHGLMSEGAAAYLAEQGFSDTYSLEGGFAAWRLH
ncbi:MAG: thiosulfate sulfurtransferase GlpE [Gammaproteobacteria bacterium]|jgi:thiosulfate sulfurtransferase|nr:thiosulfate sulfurtransferase GlpE [Gammaproteobacteria bacterium]MDP6537420.1 thiosulfate sulfurtransferase GlpE [Gammaproteobacteria bacterium]MDP6733411.1 thiosulfate sulfurtransferase GlpE [Gammaproteobacteria bacterium]HAJ76283.1 thiosulfate sulfurtransferase GlpE [Gammaproteobacteria bacterium]|tara:strand:- start:103 stop:408 length:306 start_codon:yes stop_codon:yes gene_type:complete